MSEREEQLATIHDFILDLEMGQSQSSLSDQALDSLEILNAMGHYDLVDYLLHKVVR